MCCYKGYLCLFWLSLSVGMTFIVVAVFSSMHLYMGGPFPTYSFDIGTRLLYASCTLNLLTCIAALLVILQFQDTLLKSKKIVKWIVFAFMNIILLYSFFSNIFSLSTLAREIKAIDIQVYGQDYQDYYGQMPPFVKSLQSYTKSLVIDGVPLGCCGHTDFNDYLLSPAPTKCDPSQNLQQKPYRYVNFSAPQSCCKISSKQKEADCGDGTNFKINQYATYDAQLYVQKLFVKLAKEATSFDDIKRQANKMGRNFSDWISGDNYIDPITKKKVEIGPDELPRTDGTIDFKPRYDCNADFRFLYKEHLGDWDNKTQWESNEVKKPNKPYPRSKKYAGENYLAFVELDVKTSVLGCGEFLELILGDNKFIQIVLEAKGVGMAKLGIQVVRGTLIGFTGLLIILYFLNILSFNYYYVPLILYPGRWPDLPFYPIKNKVYAMDGATESQAPINKEPEPEQQKEPSPVESTIEPEPEPDPPAFTPGSTTAMDTV